MTSADEFFDLVITRIESLARGIKSFRLERPEGGALPGFSAGAHIVVSFGTGTKTHRNSYTLTGEPDESEAYTICVMEQSAGRGGSAYLHARMRVGDRVTVRVPMNYFALSKTTRKHVLIAGGIGITPFVTMARKLSAAAEAFELHYGFRGASNAAFASHLSDNYPDHVRLYDSAAAERMPIGQILARQPLGTNIYVCGPVRLVAQVLATATSLGWPKSAIHFEKFQRPTGASFTFSVQNLARQITVHADQTMLEAMEDAELAVPSLCRIGACGRCKVSVRSCDGQIEHNDHVLEIEERLANGAVIPCVSRFSGRELVIEVRSARP